MQYKPLLVSALEPAKHWRDNDWMNLDELAVGKDATPALDVPSDSLLTPYIVALFGYQKPRLSVLPQTLPIPKDPQRRFNETSWNADEDQLLKQIVDDYPGNWSLIADVFNSSRVTISTDKRSAWDCLARWDAKWNEGRILAPGNAPPSLSADGTVDLASFVGAVPPTPVSSHTMWMMTRKRSAGQLNLSLNGQQAESRKRRRHNHMHEAMRKSAKKREATQKQNGKFFFINIPLQLFILIVYSEPNEAARQ
ncbi:hypothetical protein M422DRAFT_156505 [Sphaerobolus stellatus SS14]|nr:hypothetical protein M422DRAFT_156505 [Sphaerobolus stellatus SS14]